MRAAAQIRRTAYFVAAAAFAALTAPSVLAAQAPKAPEISADELVKAAVANQIEAAKHPNPLHMFRSHKKTPKGSQTKLYVETDEALAAMLIAVNDQPITPQQQQAEDGHLEWLMNNPDQLRKKHAREKADEERTMRIVRALPDAFNYQYAGTETGAAGLGQPGEPLLKLTFEPNPSYSPPSRVEQALGGMHGYLLIDSKLRRIAEIDSTLFRDVNFGWGIIGHLDKGGHFVVRQGDLGLGDGQWGITEMNIDITGKILLFKGLSMVSDEVLSDFRNLGKSLTFAQGVELLKAEQDKLAHDLHQPGEAQKTEAQKTPQ